MSLVTQIKPQKNKKRFNIFLDGKFSFGLDAEVLVKQGLKVGQELKPEQVEKLIKENELQKILDRVFNFLSFRPRSQKEILNFLKRKQVGEQTQDLIIKKLADLKMIDDLAFASWWSEQRQTFRPEGQRLLKMELKNKGIAKEIIDQALKEQKPVSQLAMAEKLLAKKKNQLQKLSFEERKKKIYGLLLRRGFSYETVKKLIGRDFDEDFQ